MCIDLRIADTGVSRSSALLQKSCWPTYIWQFSFFLFHMCCQGFLTKHKYVWMRVGWLTQVQLHDPVKKLHKTPFGICSLLPYAGLLSAFVMAHSIWPCVCGQSDPFAFTSHPFTLHTCETAFCSSFDQTRLLRISCCKIPLLTCSPFK